MSLTQETANIPSMFYKTFWTDSAIEVKQTEKAVTSRTLLAKPGKKSKHQILYLLISVRNMRQNSRKIKTNFLEKNTHTYIYSVLSGITTKKKTTTKNHC